MLLTLKGGWEPCADVLISVGAELFFCSMCAVMVFMQVVVGAGEGVSCALSLC